jgi:hypothetical protein
MRRPLVVIAPLVVLAATSGAAGCGGAKPSRAEDTQAIRAVLVQNETAGPERCDRIYTTKYLAENWKASVTSVPGTTPLAKCRASRPIAGITTRDLLIKVIAIHGDRATASTQVRSEAAVTFSLVRTSKAWRIDGFAD